MRLRICCCVCSGFPLQVPIQYKYFANTIQQCPDYWTDEDKIRADLELEAMGNDKIETFLAMVRAQSALVQRFLSQELSKDDDAGLQAAMVDVGLIEGEENPMFEGVEFNRGQRRFEKSVNKLLDRAKKVLEKVLGPDPRIRILMAFPIGREVLGLKFDASG